MGDLDFDEIEAVLEGQHTSSQVLNFSEPTRSTSTARPLARQSRSRSNSRRRYPRSSSESDYERSVSRKKRSGRHHKRHSSSRDRRDRSNSLERHAAAEHARNVAVVEKRMREEDEKRKKEFDEARRDDLTVLILNLTLKATERDVWKFFSERAGKVRDIQVIRDSRSGKSKGVGYVEFYAPQSVLQALALSGSYILDIPIVVQASQAEKNRAARAAKQQAAEITEGGPMKIYVGGLVEALSTLSESDLKQLFSPFGDITNVDIHKDPYTGYAFIHFRNAQDAREAMTAMNGFDINGQQIKVSRESKVFQVGYATDPVQRATAPIILADSIHGVPLGNNLAAAQHALQNGHNAIYVDNATDNERLDDEGGGLLSGANPRISLMQKLQRVSGNSPNNGPTTTTSQLTASPAFSANICLDSLFTASDAGSDPSFLTEVVDDVKTECSKYGVVMQVWVNKKEIDGKVWIKFGGPDQAVKAHQALNGRYFAGNKISVTFVTEAIVLTFDTIRDTKSPT